MQTYFFETYEEAWTFMITLIEQGVTLSPPEHFVDGWVLTVEGEV